MSRHIAANLARLRAVLPDDIARKQAKWELAQQIQRARRAGATCEQIGRVLGVARQRVHQLEHAWQTSGRPAPLTAYLNRPLDLGAVALAALPTICPCCFSLHRKPKECMMVEGKRPSSKKGGKRGG